MKHVAAYLLAVLGGNTTPSKDDVKKILDAAGVEADSDRLDKLFAEVEGKDVNELINSGRSKLAAVPAGGARAAAPAAAAPAAPAAGAAPAKPEKKEEVKEESDEDMGFGLFD